MPTKGEYISDWSNCLHPSDLPALMVPPSPTISIVILWKRSKISQLDKRAHQQKNTLGKDNKLRLIGKVLLLG